MRYNVVHDVRGDPVGGDGAGCDIDIDNTNCKTLYNICYNCDGGGIYIISNSGTGTTHVMAFNLVINCGRTNQGGIWVGSVDGCQIYDNTIINQSGTMPAVNCQSTATSVNKKIYNNILVTPAGVSTVNLPTTGSGFALQGNAYLSGTNSFLCTYNGVNSTSLASWRTATGQETSPHGFALTGSPFQGPLTPIPPFVPSNLTGIAAYYLAQGNVLVGTGLDLNSLYSVNPGTTDLLGHSIAVPYSVGAINPQYTTYSVSGPATGVSGTPSTNFTLTPAAATLDTITLSDGGAGGTFTPASLTISSASAVTFTYTPLSTGVITLTLTSLNGFTITGSPLTYTSTSSYSVSGPSSGAQGQPSTNFTITPAGNLSDTITFTDSGAGGTFTPNSISWSGDHTPHTFTYTPVNAGLITIALISSGGFTVTGSSFTYVLTPTTGGIPYIYGPGAFSPLPTPVTPPISVITSTTIAIPANSPTQLVPQQKDLYYQIYNLGPANILLGPSGVPNGLGFILAPSAAFPSQTDVLFDLTRSVEWWGLATANCTAIVTQG